MNTGLIVLAGGESKRMGMTKQVLPIAEVPMLKYIIDELLQTNLHPITVVLGANKPKIVPVLEGMPIGIIDNSNWKDGEGSSVKMGIVGSYMQTKGFEAMIVVPSDMPDINTQLITDLLNFSIKGSDKDLVITENLTYPVLIKAAAFEKLLDLKGDKPFENYLGLDKTKVAIFKATQTLRDLNVPEDYLKYLESKN